MQSDYLNSTDRADPARNWQWVLDPAASCAAPFPRGLHATSGSQCISPNACAKASRGEEASQSTKERGRSDSLPRHRFPSGSSEDQPLDAHVIMRRENRA